MAKLPLVINSVDKTKHSFALLHQRVTTVSLETNSLTSSLVSRLICIYFNCCLTLGFLYYQVVKVSSFLDFIQGGCQLNFTVSLKNPLICLKGDFVPCVNILVKNEPPSYSFVPFSFFPCSIPQGCIKSACISEDFFFFTCCACITLGCWFDDTNLKGNCNSWDL